LTESLSLYAVLDLGSPISICRSGAYPIGESEIFHLISFPRQTAFLPKGSAPLLAISHQPLAIGAFLAIPASLHPRCRCHVHCIRQEYW